MNRLFAKLGVHPNRIKAYVLAVLGLMFVGAVLAGMFLTLEVDEKRNILPISLTGAGELPYTPNLSGSYLASQFARSHQDFESAAEYAATALAKDPENLVLKEHALRLMVSAGNIEASEALAAEMLAMESVDALAVMVRAGQLLREEKYAQAEALIEKPITKGMFHLIQPVLKQWIAVGKMQKGEIEPLAVEDIPGIDMNGFLALFMQYQRGLMNDMLGFDEGAEDAYGIATKNPSLAPYRVVQAVSNYYMRQGDKEQGEKIYQLYALHHPDSQLVPQKVPYSDAEAKDVPALVANPAEGVAEIYFTAASLLFGEHVNQETMLYIRLALALRPDFPPAQMMLANIYEQYEAYDSAVSVYQSIDPDSIFFRRGRLRVALNYRAAGQTDQAVQLLENIIDDAPQHEEAVLVLGDLYRFEEKYAKAIQVFKEAVKRLENTDWEFHYKYGIALERHGDWQEAEEQFLKALELEPAQPDVLNYLGYSWLEQNRKLQDAKEAIEAAYEQRPDQAHIIDSMGWVHFKLYDFEVAVEFLEEATTLAPQDPTINDHLGDAYWRVGRRFEARYQWQRALNFEPDEPKVIERKLEEGLPALKKTKPSKDTPAEDE